MSCSNGQCGVGRPVEFIGGPLDGHIERSPHHSNILYAVLRVGERRPIDGERVAIYQLDALEQHYLFRNETIWHQPIE